MRWNRGKNFLNRSSKRVSPVYSILVQHQGQVTAVRQQAVFGQVRRLWLSKRHVPTECPLTKGLDGSEASSYPRDLGIQIGILPLRQDRLVGIQTLALEAPRGVLTLAVTNVDRRATSLETVVEKDVRLAKLWFEFLDRFIDHFHAALDVGELEHVPQRPTGRRALLQHDGDFCRSSRDRTFPQPLTGAPPSRIAEAKSVDVARRSSSISMKFDLPDAFGPIRTFNELNSRVSHHRRKRQQSIDMNTLNETHGITFEQVPDEVP